MTSPDQDFPETLAQRRAEARSPQNRRDQDNGARFPDALHVEMSENGKWKGELRDAARALGRLLKFLTVAGIFIGGWGFLVIVTAMITRSVPGNLKQSLAPLGVSAEVTFVVSLAVFNLYLMRRAPSVRTYLEWLFGQCVLIVGNYLITGGLLIMLASVADNRDGLLTPWQAAIVFSGFAIVFIGIARFHARKNLLERAVRAPVNLLKFLTIAGIYVGVWGVFSDNGSDGIKQTHRGGKAITVIFHSNGGLKPSPRQRKTITVIFSPHSGIIRGGIAGGV
jgi:hypothetical protein